MRSDRFVRGQVVTCFQGIAQRSARRVDYVDGNDRRSVFQLNLFGQNGVDRLRLAPLSYFIKQPNKNLIN